MSKTILLTMAMLLCASLVLAQLPGSIGVFADVAATDCNLDDLVGPNIPINVFVIHVFTAGATQSQFKLVQMDGANLTYFGDTVNPAFGGVGNTQTGITITYNACIPASLWLASAHYWGNGLSATCSSIKVVPDPSAVPAGVLVWDCAQPPQVKVATGGGLVINPDPSCDCTIPVEDATWGRLKALYIAE